MSARARYHFDNTYPGMRATAVAELMGYRSIASFSGAFKKRCGMSPTEYQRRYQRGASPAKIKE